MYDKAVEEIKEICWNCIKGKINEEQLDKDLEQFLIKFEEEMIEANREEIEQQTIENYEPIRDESHD